MPRLFTSQGRNCAVLVTFLKLILTFYLSSLSNVPRGMCKSQEGFEIQQQIWLLLKQTALCIALLICFCGLHDCVFICFDNFGSKRTV